MRTFSKKAWAAAAITALAATAHSAEIPLYETGPGQDAAFVRFVNARSAAIDVKAAGSKASAKLAPEQPASNFFPVPANRAVKGQFSDKQLQSEIAVSVKPGEFATVVALSGSGEIKQVVLREQPDDFNALKVSLALYNLDKRCKAAGLNVLGRSAALFEGVAIGSLARRTLNPVNISVQLQCQGQLDQATLALGTLQAGQRYSIFVMPADAGSRLVIAADQLAQ